MNVNLYAHVYSFVVLDRGYLAFVDTVTKPAFVIAPDDPQQVLKYRSGGSFPAFTSQF